MPCLGSALQLVVEGAARDSEGSGGGRNVAGACVEGPTYRFDLDVLQGLGRSAWRSRRGRSIRRRQDSLGAAGARSSRRAALSPSAVSNGGRKVVQADSRV